MLAPDTSLGSYRLIAPIGAGGMGEVWKAEDTRLGRIVAVKILPLSVSTDAEATARLRREARTAAQLNHPNIATVHSIEEADGRLFIVMEFVDGEPLSKVIKRGPIAEAELCRVGRGVADALSEAHAKGIVHRDIKPDNIIVSGARVKVLDFGIAKQVAITSPDAATQAVLTQQGMIVGTVHYMSPEQALGKPLDARTDIFSLGVVLYEAATGRRPFEGETITETMTQIIRDEPEEPSRVNPGVSPALNTIIQRCLRKNREQRFATAADLGQALDRQLGKAPTAPTARHTPAPATVLTAAAQPRQRTRWPWIAAAAVIVIVFGSVVAMQRRSVAAGVSPAQVRPRTAAPTPGAPTARAHFRFGEQALFNHNFQRAIEQYQLALDQKENLDPRERHLARLGIAVAMRNRPMVQEIAREIMRRWPNDPDLARIQAEFGGEAQRPFGRRRQQQ
jgi:eukaryotic-like serine/threonine-protein kinase